MVNQGITMSWGEKKAKKGDKAALQNLLCAKIQ
jgi:hypothetical protein